MWWSEHAWPIGSGTVRRRGLGGGVSQWGGPWRSPVLRLHPLQKRASSQLPEDARLSWLPLNQDVELSAPPAPHLPACCHTSAMTIMDRTSETVSQLQLNVCLYTSCLGHGVSSQQWKPSVRQPIYKQCQTLRYWVFEVNVCTWEYDG